MKGLIISLDTYDLTKTRDRINVLDARNDSIERIS